MKIGILNLFTCPEEHFSIYSNQKIRILFGLWAENFRKGSQNCILRVQKNISKKNNLFEKKWLILKSFDSERKIFGLWATISGRVVRKAFYVLKGAFWVQKKTWTLWLPIGKLRKKVCLLRDWFSVRITLRRNIGRSESQIIFCFF